MLKVRNCSFYVHHYLKLINSAISVWADELATINQPTLKKIDVLTFNDFHGNVLKDGKNIDSKISRRY